MDERNKKLLEDSNGSMSSVWLFVVGMLCALFVFVNSIAPDLGWGQPSAEELMTSAIGEDIPTIIYTNDWRNCGGSSGHQGGCFSPYTADTIYISPNLRYVVLKYVVLHELAHYKQLQDGEEINECNADAQAKIWGADISGSGYDCK